MRPDIWHLDSGQPKADGAAMDTDVLIVGGGMVGLTLAVGLAKGGLTSVLVDHADPLGVLDANFDGRASALSYAPCRMYEALGVWPHLQTHAQPIHEIRVADGRGPGGRGGKRPSPLFLHFDQDELGEGPFGHMVENRHIRRGLDAAASQCEEITRLAPATVNTLERGADKVRATVEAPSGPVEVTARLAVAADGRHSATREGAGIRVVGWPYNQTAIVATVEHQRDHGGVASEYFLPAGPFAVLPLTGRRSSLVWTEGHESAKTIMALGQEAFDEEMRARFGDYLGAAKTTGPRWSYPLALHNARTYVARRLALAGDAAHAMHPIAGQGLNLGLRDVAALAQVLTDTKRLGLDIGAAEVLARYQRWRRFDSFLLLAVTDGLNRLFSNDIKPLRLARDLGLEAVGRLPALKRFFMRQARGTVGDLPRLLEGREL